MNYEKIEQTIETMKLDMENAKQAYLETEAEIIAPVYEKVVGLELTSKSFGVGKVLSIEGETLDTLIINVEFPEAVKRLSLIHLMNSRIFNKFSDPAFYDLWSKLFDVHKMLATTYQSISYTLKDIERQAAQKAEADRLAEEKYQQQKERALQSFENLTNKSFEHSSTDNFYFALGWLTKHVGTISAALPDYLESAFQKHFGTDTPCRVVDSRHRGPAGWQSQWTWSFSATLKKIDEIPAILHQYLNPKSTAITDTSFVWNLVDNYGFQFGKKQDKEKIAETIPAKYIDSFNTGLAA